MFLLFNGLQVEERVEPFAHELALSPLNLDLLLGQGSQENEESEGITNGPVGPDLWQAGSHLVSEIVLSNIEQVGSGVEASEEG